MKSKTVRAALLLTLGSAVMLGGCGTSNKQLASIRSNQTPALDSLDMRYVDMANRRHLGHDTNFRNLRGTMSRALFFDRPSRLTPHPVPY